MLHCANNAKSIFQDALFFNNGVTRLFFKMELVRIFFFPAHSLAKNIMFNHLS